MHYGNHDLNLDGASYLPPSYPDFQDLLGYPAVPELAVEPVSLIPHALQSVRRPPTTTVNPAAIMRTPQPLMTPPHLPVLHYNPQAWIPAPSLAAAASSSSSQQALPYQPALPKRVDHVDREQQPRAPKQARRDGSLPFAPSAPKPKGDYAVSSLLTYHSPGNPVECREAHVRLLQVINENLSPVQQANVQEIMERKKVILAQKMGSGKTRQALLSLFQPMWNKILLSGKTQSFHPILIVCGKTLFSTWRQEIENVNGWLKSVGLEFLKINYMTYNPGKTESSRYNQLMSMGTTNTQICFVTYDTLKKKDHLRILSLLPRSPEQKRSKTRRWRGVIFDESHNLKKVETKRSDGAVTFLKRSRPDMVIAVTGTPVDNHLSDLCGQLALLNPRLFNKKWAEHFESKVSECTRLFLKRYVNGTLPENWEQTLHSAKEKVEAGNANDEDDSQISEVESESEEEDVDNDPDEIEYDEPVELDDDASEYYKLKKIENVGTALQYVRGLVRAYIIQNNQPAAAVAAGSTPQRIQETVFWEMSTFQALLYKAYEDIFLRTPLLERNTMLFVQTLCKVYDYPELIEQGKSENNKKVYRQVQEELRKQTQTNVAEDDLPRVISTDEHQKLWISGKLEALKGKIMEINRVSPGNKIIIFVNMRYMAKVLIEHLQLMSFDPILVSGELPEKTRNERIALAKQTQNPAQSILILTEGVGSEGLCLPEFNYVVNFDLPWSPNKLAQQIARSDRMGQSRQVHVVDFACTNNLNKVNLDKYFRLMHEVKTRTATSALNPAEDDPLIGLIPEVEVDFDSLLKRTMESEEDLKARQEEAQERKEKKEKKTVEAPDVQKLFTEHMTETEKRELEELLGEVEFGFCSPKTAVDAVEDLLSFGEFSYGIGEKIHSDNGLKRSRDKFDDLSDQEHLQYFIGSSFRSQDEAPSLSLSSSSSLSSSGESSGQEDQRT